MSQAYQYLRRHDSLMGSAGDAFLLDKEGKIVFDKRNYFLIRMDSLKNNR